MSLDTPGQRCRPKPAAAARVFEWQNLYGSTRGYNVSSPNGLGSPAAFEESAGGKPQSYLSRSTTVRVVAAVPQEDRLWSDDTMFEIARRFGVTWMRCWRNRDYV